ncbi:hypothetical protein CTEN210_14106 [Chaetoceros tenuissimus]|uniref:GYF domain-containing protein n=1 Tax=Chaetoceros tenuissimus TaxID=426638 RepID=A0AAD3D6E3_9STRA|nr:hypothetical protein CTEN210_14106 [Chaetoceros tenuissimus]
MANPLDDYKQQQRKKEKRKNKTKRISERDQKVAESTSLSSVQSDINKLETKKKNQNDHLDTKDTRKLERLRKELKIVIGAEEDRKKQREEKARLEWEERKQRMKTKEGVEELNQQKFKKAKASIYYDPVMNPYGAPPPGQPMLYHTKSGGKTLDINEAFIPYNLRDENDEDSVQSEKHDNIIIEKGDDDGHSPEKGKQEEVIQYDFQKLPIREVKEEKVPPPPPPPKPQRVPPPARIPEKHSVPKQEVPVIKESKPSGPPTLPKPSEAVQRLQRRKGKKRAMMADIWASQEEINYEGEDLEGSGMQTEEKDKYSFKKRKKMDREDVYDPLCPADEGYSDYRSKEQIQKSTTSKKKVTDGDKDHMENGKISVKKVQWYYIDQSAIVQGPFQSDQMIGWNSAGFFPSDTMVRNGDDGEFVELGTVDLATGESKQEITIQAQPEESVEDRIAALKQSMQAQPEESVEDRIAALKQSMQAQPEESVEDRIAALKQSMQAQPEESVEDRIAALKQSMQAQPEESVEDRIAALKQSMQAQPEESVEDRIAALKQSMQAQPEESVEDRIAALKQSMQAQPEESVEDRIAALKNQEINISREEAPPAYPMDDDEPPAYPMDDEAPPAYPMDDDEPPAYPMDDDEPPAYPMDDEAPPAYPMDDDKAPPAYPVDEDDNVPYPTDVAYPVDEYAYPNTDSAYETAEADNVAPYYIPVADNNRNEQMEKNETKKAKFTGDKAVVGFVPANLKVRRTKSQKPVKKKKASTAQAVQLKKVYKKLSSGAVSDDYEKFMNEINSLK